MMLKTKTQIKLKLSLYRILYFLTKSNYFYRKKKKYKLLFNDYKKLNHSAPIQVPTDLINLQYQIDIVKNNDNEFINKKRNRVLIIGRDKVGDSIGNHTKSFLNEIDYNKIIVHLFDEYTKNIYEYSSRNERKIIWQGEISSLEGKLYDCLLFLNVLDYGKNDKIEEKLPHSMPLLSYCYCVFEGSIPPQNWVNHINRYFDGLLVPIDNLKKIFLSYGVLKPIFTLPVSLDLNRYLKQIPKRNPIFRFGWSGTLDPRKNPVKVLKTFIKLFKDNPKVELRMHSRYLNKSKYAQSFYKLIETAPKNVKFTNCVLSDEEHFNLMKSFDAYVFPSMGEGYSVTPREILALGGNVILSDIDAHKEITDLDEQDGVFWCRADIPVDAIHTTLNNQSCGKMLDIHEGDLERKMLKIYENRHNLSKKVKIQKRKDSVKRFDINSLKKTYMELLYCHQIVRGKDNLIHEEYLETNSSDLVIKYKYYLKKQGYSVTVDPMNDAGFFSLFNKYISHLAYADDNEILIPDWRSSQLRINKLNHSGMNRFEHFCYGKETDKNVFLKFFQKPYPENIVKDEIYQTDLMYTIADKVLKIDDYNYFNEPNLTYINSYNLYNDKEYFPVFRKKYNDVIKKHIHLLPHIQKIIDDFYQENMKDYFVICAHLRCQSHVLELLENYPTFELYEKNVLRILSENKIEPFEPNWKLFIATDNDDALNYFLERYPDHVIFQKDIKRLTAEQEQEYKQVRDSKKKDVAGFELQERQAADESTRDVRLGIDIITDAYLLSMGKYFLYVNSNISTAVSYLNPEIEMVYCK